MKMWLLPLTTKLSGIYLVFCWCTIGVHQVFGWCAVGVMGCFKVGKTWSAGFGIPQITLLRLQYIMGQYWHATDILLTCHWHDTDTSLTSYWHLGSSVRRTDTFHKYRITQIALYFNCPLTEQLLSTYCTATELMGLRLSQAPWSIFHKYSLARVADKVQVRNR